jgi:hypothetical protein
MPPRAGARHRGVAPYLPDGRVPALAPGLHHSASVVRTIWTQARNTVRQAAKGTQASCRSPVQEVCLRRAVFIRSALAAGAFAGLAALGPSLGTGASTAPFTRPLTIVYDTAATTHQLVFPRKGPGLSPTRGDLRQDGAPQGMFTPGSSAPYRISKISGADLARLPSSQMVAALKAQITRGTYGAQAHLVSIDEMLENFGEAPPANPQSNPPLPRVNPNSPGARFTDAMRIMASQQSPWGGTWASRVEVYISPGMVTSIADGRGPLRNLGEHNKPIAHSWRAVMPGLALVGGIHLEMYHGMGTPLKALTAAQWRAAPGAFIGLLRRYGGSASEVHFMITATTFPAGAPRGYGSAMEASWSLARSTPAGRTVLANGPDAYRLGNNAAQWLAEYNREFPG